MPGVDFWMSRELGPHVRLSARMLSDDRARRSISAQAAKLDLPRRDFQAIALLHLPLLYEAEHSPSADQIQALVAGLGATEALAVAPFRSWLAGPQLSEHDLPDLQFAPLSAGDAQVVFSRFHYLRSVRSDAENWSLFYGKRIVAAASISPCDLNHLGPIPGTGRADEAAVLSRVYAFPGAPKNTLSYFFAKLSKVAQRAGLKVLLTYVNPNLGFTGVSYRSANWSLFAEENGTRYQYLDGQYVTDRRLKALYGTSDPRTLHRRLGPRVVSVCEGLDPLLVFAYWLNKRDRAAFDGLPVRSAERPE